MGPCLSAGQLSVCIVFITSHKLNRGKNSTTGRFVAYPRRVVSYEPTQTPQYRAYESPVEAACSQKTLGLPWQSFNIPAHTNLCPKTRYARIYHQHSPSRPAATAAGCSHHKPPRPGAPNTPESRGPLTPAPTTRRRPPTARAPADRARVGVAAADRRRWRRLAVGAAPAAGAAANLKRGIQERGRR